MGAIDSGYAYPEKAGMTKQYSLYTLFRVLPSFFTRNFSTLWVRVPKARGIAGLFWVRVPRVNEDSLGTRTQNRPDMTETVCFPWREHAFSGARRGEKNGKMHNSPASFQEGGIA